MHPSLKLLSWAIAPLFLSLSFSVLIGDQNRGAIAQTTQDKKAEGDRRLQQGIEQCQTSQYEAALKSWEQALVIYRSIQDRKGEADALMSLGLAYNSLSQYEKAIAYYQQALPIYQKVKDLNGEAMTLDNLGNTYRHLSQYEKAIAHYQHSLFLHQQVKDRNGEAKVLNNLGTAYRSLSQYEQAIAYYQQAIPLFQEAKDRNSEARALNNLGIVYESLSQYEKAITYYQRSLILHQQTKDRNGEADAFNNLGNIYQALSQYEKAIGYYQQAIPLYQQVKDFNGEAGTLNNLGNVYHSLSQYEKAIAYYQQALPLFQRIGDKNDEAAVIGNLGNAYDSLSQYDKAISYFQQALPLLQQIQDREGEGLVLSNIGLLFQRQHQPELAIVFYKQSVNVRETIRVGIRNLPRESQESYTQSVAGTYRALATLLIQQRRLPEAQAVLELLKLQELRDFTRDAGINSTGISLAKVEETALNQILKQFTTLGNFAQVLAKCEREQCSTLNQLEQQRDNLYIAVNKELDQQRATLAKYFATEPGTLLSDKLNAEARNIVNSQPGTVLIYPLVLKDKIQFLLALKTGNGAVTFRPFETTISADKLFTQIQTFRNQLQSPGNLKQLQATSQELYKALIQPLEPELNNPQVKHLVFAPDSIIRYIPLAALYDGKQYLIQRFSISTITAASKTDTTDTTPKPTANQALLLAMGASTFPNLPPLNSVPVELNAITRTDRQDSQGIYPGRELLNREFDYNALKANLKTGTYRILHIATHGAFKPGRPEDSYLVPGRGDNLTTSLIDALGNYGLHNIHLVVLSACETAVGDRASDGIEIPGISYFFLKNEVKSVMASLWSVNDASTALLMQQFYKLLATGMTKAEALQKVQQDLINGKLTAKDAPRDSRDADVTVTSTRAAPPPNTFSHPYYWAPFILIGNSL